LREGSGSGQPPSPDEGEVLALLRTRGLSIKGLDPLTKEKVRLYLVRKHIEQGVSLTDLAKLIGNKTSGYTSWLSRQVGVQPRDFEEARLRGIHEKVRKYERRPFDGSDEDRAYLLGLRHGDLSVSRPFGLETFRRCNPCFDVDHPSFYGEAVQKPLRAFRARLSASQIQEGHALLRVEPFHDCGRQLLFHAGIPC